MFYRISQSVYHGTSRLISLFEPENHMGFDPETWGFGHVSEGIFPSKHTPAITVAFAEAMVIFSVLWSNLQMTEQEGLDPSVALVLEIVIDSIFMVTCGGDLDRFGTRSKKSAYIKCG